MSPTTSSVAQNLFYAQNQLIDITYIQKLSTFFFKLLQFYPHKESNVIIFFRNAVIYRFINISMFIKSPLKGKIIHNC